MRHSRAGGSPTQWTVLSFATILFLLPTLIPPPSRAAEISVSSKTYLLFFEREVLGGKDQDFAPLYEYLSADASDVKGMPLSLHFSGWGRVDLGDDQDNDGKSGDIASGYLQYLHPTGNAEARLGRFFLAEGAAAETLDGIFLKARTPAGLGLSLFGGVPVEDSSIATDEGDSIYGGRIFFSRTGFAEVGVSYLFEDGEFQGDDRELVGWDLWVRPAAFFELIGRASYNLSTSDIATQRYVLRLMPFAAVDLAVGYEEYDFKGLFQTALNSAFLFPGLNPDDEVRTGFAVLRWAALQDLSLEAGVKHIEHDKGDPGDADRAELGARYSYNDRKDIGGLSFAVVAADKDENEYYEIRAFATYSPGKWRFALDALTHQYEKVSGDDEEYQVVGSAGFSPLPHLKVSGDLTYTTSPRFDEDLAGLIRVSLDLGTTVGGY